MEARVIVTTELQLKAIVADAVSAAFKYCQPTLATPAAEPYGDFSWLCATLTMVPASTLRIKSAAGEIPGTKKIGKRVLYEKAAVLDWLHDQQYVPRPKSEELETAAEAQFTAQHQRRGGRSKAA